jgi:hypothetical protein
MSKLRYDIRSGVTKAKTKLTLAITAFGLVIGGSGASLALVGVTHAATCTPVSTSKGNLTAAQVGGNATGNVDATGCDIGVYYNSPSGNVKDAMVHDANQYGVFIDATSVNVTGSEIYNIGHHTGASFTPNGGQYGVGVYYYSSDSTSSANGKVSGNNVHDYQKGGVVVNGSKSSANVSGNSVTGLSNVPFIAQNGIQFGYGGTGQAMKNTVNGNWYTGANWASTGILVFESDNVSVDGNTVMNNQTGVDAESWCYFGVGSASNNKFINNTITGSDYGAVVAAYSYNSDCDAVANNNKITNNIIEGTNNVGSEGIFVGTAVVTVGYGPTTDNNKVVHNEVTGFETLSDTSGDVSAKVHANSFQ